MPPLPTSLQVRIDTYHNETEPMLGKLATEFNYKVFKIDSMPNPKTIKESINKIIEDNIF